MILHSNEKYTTVLSHAATHEHEKESSDKDFRHELATLRLVSLLWKSPDSQHSNLDCSPSVYTTNNEENAVRSTRSVEINIEHILQDPTMLYKRNDIEYTVSD